MSSRDYGFLTLRNIVAYQYNGDVVSANNIFVTSTNGAAIFSNYPSISTLNASTLNINTFNVSTTVNISKGEYRDNIIIDIFINQDKVLGFVI